nr:GGDEF domain-containing protein [Motilibacter deserti]
MFNLGLYALEAAVAVSIYSALLGSADPAGPRGWIAALVALLVTDLLGATLVTLVIVLDGDGFEPAILREAVTSGFAAAIANTCAALLVVVVVTDRPAALPLLGALLAVLFVAYKVHADLARRYSRVDSLYRFVGSVGASVELDVAVGNVLEAARDLLGASRAELAILPGPGQQGIHVVLEADQLMRPLVGAQDAASWWAPALRGEPVIAGSPSGPDGPAEGTAMAAPVSTGGQTVGALLVSDRLFEGEAFRPEDLKMFEALAAHAAVTLQNARLVDRLRAEAAARDHEARHDPLTGLANRREFVKRVEAVVDHGRAAVLLVDLDEFKEVNDTLGHDAGDEALREMGRRLAYAAGGHVARLGGDEFAILLTGVDDAGTALARAADVLDVVRGAPVEVDGVRVFVGGTIGVALVPDHGRTGDELLANADIATQSARAAGVTVDLYEPGNEQARRRRLVLAAEMAGAIESGDVQPWFQPKALAQTGEVCAVEALVRWRHPVYGIVPPNEILAVAERTGQVRQLTDHVLESALQQAAAWADRGLDISVAVNITTLDLSDDDLPLVVDQLLRETGVPAHRLTLEITESGIMRDPERCLAVLHRLAAAGLHLSVDDFGTGYSSLAYLERLPLNEVKIDRSFVMRLADWKHDDTVIRFTVDLGHALGLSVVAEGVENAVVWERLAAIGVDVIQGYHLGRPTPAVELDGLLEERALRIDGPCPYVLEESAG